MAREGVLRAARDVETPCFLIDLGHLQRNLDLLGDVQRRAECKILLALKGFATWSVFPVVREVLSGIAASSPYEAQLGHEEFGREVHTYAPAYSEKDLRALAPLSDHLVFNSLAQWQRYRALQIAGKPGLRCGVRINPEHSEVSVSLYDPCAQYSRLGVTQQQFELGDWNGITGLHFHTLCQKNADALQRTLATVEARFEQYLPQMEWVNFGGGHHITRVDYDRDLLVRLIRQFSERWGVQVYLEPGEAVALDCGLLVASVLDVVDNGMNIAILDTSATAHMPDVLEMPYRPEVIGAGEAGEFKHTYRLGGLTCLAGDIVGDYSVPEPLKVGDRLIFTDMAHYTTVKTTLFNGVQHPSIALYSPDTRETEVVRRFGYRDYRDRLS